MRSFGTANLATRAAACLTALSLGALGYAAHAGVLPDPAQTIAHGWFGAIGVPEPDQSATAEPATDPTAAAPSPQASTAVPQPSPTPTQPPIQAPDTTSLVGLCHTVVGMPGAGPGPAMSAAAFQRLAAAAGGANRIETYCTDLLAAAAPDHPEPTGDDQSGPPESPGQGEQGSGQGEQGSGQGTGQPGGSQTVPPSQPARSDQPAGQHEQPRQPVLRLAER